MTTEFAKKYGPWALVTGGAQGMGEAFARAIAAHGLNLILLDREDLLLKQTASAISAEFNCETIPLTVDLAEPGFMDEIHASCSELEVGLLIACAASGHVGPFVDTPIEDMIASVRINIDAPLLLSHHYCKAMQARGRGGIILFASSAAYQGSPFVANYAATKAYNLSLGEALWFELGEHGVDVLAISPGATNTPGMRSAHPTLKAGVKLPGILLPEETAAAALAALGKHPSVRPSFRDSLETFFMTRILSRKSAVKLIGQKLVKNLSRTVPEKNSTDKQGN